MPSMHAWVCLAGECIPALERCHVCALLPCGRHASRGVAADRFFPESYQRFIGIYWGQVSTPFCAETVEASDAYLFAGPIFNDYTRCCQALKCIRVLCL